MTDHQALVDAGDSAALLGAVDAACSRRDWDGLVDLARRCDAAAEWGRQLWGVAQHCRYRLALEAPPRWAGAVVRSGAARFALGPLTEVVGHRFAWADVAEHLPEAHAAAVVAAECALRGEDLRDDPIAEQADLPLALFAFEPDYALPTYASHAARFPTPATRPIGAPRDVAITPGPTAPPDEATTALAAVVEGWGLDEGSGPVSTRSPDGTLDGALAPLLGGAPVTLTPIASGEALAWLAWAGASGGAHGRRRGGAAGRFAAWWALAALAGLDWPDLGAPDDDLVGELAAAADELTWWRWRSPQATETGWVLRLVVADPVDDEAWAVGAHVPPPEDATDPLED